MSRKLRFKGADAAIGDAEGVLGAGELARSGTRPFPERTAVVRQPIMDTRRMKRTFSA